jgi:hypothetical protein
MVEIKRNLDRILKKSETFFLRNDSDMPLLGFFLLGRNYMQIFKRTFKNISAKKEIEPGDIIIEDFIKDIEEIIDASEEIAQDIFFPVSPFQYIPWMEAIIGCPIFVGKESLYSKPFLNNLDEYKFHEITLFANKWFKKLAEIFMVLLDLTGDRYPVSTSTHMRGPADMISAAMGPTQFCLELKDNPKKIMKLINYYTNLFIEVARLQHDLVKNSKFKHGFTVSGFGLLTPVICQHVQDDAVAILSPKIYNDFFLEAHAKIISSFESSFYHIHPVSLFIVDELIKIKKLDIIEINREPVPIGPDMEGLIPYFKKIQDSNKSIFVHFTDIDFSVNLIEKEVELVMGQLSKKGLCINVCVDTIDDGIIKNAVVNKIFLKHKASS